MRSACRPSTANFTSLYAFYQRAVGVAVSSSLTDLELNKCVPGRVFSSFGNPNNYVSRGFISCKKRNISLSDGVCPSAMMVKDLKPDALDGRHWVYRQSAVFDDLDEAAAERYDETLEPMEKKFQPSQEEFYISVHSIVQ